MPSFLSKVLGRKKKDDKDEPPRIVRDSTGESLLEDRFVEVSPTVSPTAAQFTQADELGMRGRDKEIGRFSLFRIRSGPASPTFTVKKRVEDEVPHLSLNLTLPGAKDSSTSPPALGLVFDTDPDAQNILPESVIGEKRLSPQETLVLVQACSQAINVRGLETLGIMHPHWYSASPEVQRKLVSLFIQSLASKPIGTTLAPTSPSIHTSAFDSELRFARSPHDVAAVLRWGLRHLQLDTPHFGKDPNWYENFSEAERSSNYPPNSFTEKLAPQLFPAHFELLVATLELVSSLAAHAEANSASGSKLSKFLGLWLLTAQRSDRDKDDWNTFYARWERAGRILEHLFLSRIREEALGLRIPTRLQELVKLYPYSKYAVEGDGLLPRPRFSTRRYDALLVRVDTELPFSGRGAKEHPLRLIADAFKARVSSSSGSDGGAWDRIKKAADETEADSSSEGPTNALTTIFADETVTLLNRIPTDASSFTGTKKNGASGLIPTPRSASPVRGRPFYPTDKAVGNGIHATNGSSNVGADNDKSTLKVPSSTPLPPTPIIPDWAAFSTSGFGESPQPLAATLLDDLEKDQPAERRTSTKRPQKSAAKNPKASTTEVPPPPSSAKHDEEKDLAITIPSVVTASFTQLDEAFIDFWSDAFLDPISADWPTFVICKLKPLANEEKPVSWLVIERTYTAPSTRPSQLAATSETHGGKRAASPRPSYKSGGTFGGTKKRFSLFGSRSNSNASDKAKKKRLAEKDGKVGEMGEILDEEVEKQGVKLSHEENPVEAGLAGIGAAFAAERSKQSRTELSVAPVPESAKVVDEPEIKSNPVDLPPVESHAAAPKTTSANHEPSITNLPEHPKQEPSGPTAVVGTAVPFAESHKPAEEVPAPSTATSVSPVGEVESHQASEPTIHQGRPTKGKELPSLPAPESVVLSSDAPGPQVVFSTNEPAPITHAAEPESSPSPEIAETAPGSEAFAKIPGVSTVPANDSSVPAVDETTPEMKVTLPTDPEPESVAQLPEHPVVNAKAQTNDDANLPVKEATVLPPVELSSPTSEPDAPDSQAMVVEAGTGEEPTPKSEKSLSSAPEPVAELSQVPVKTEPQNNDNPIRPIEEAAGLPADKTATPTVEPQTSTAPERDTTVAEPDATQEEPIATSVEQDTALEERIATRAEPEILPETKAVQGAESGQQPAPTEPPVVETAELRVVDEASHPPEKSAMIPAAVESKPPAEETTVDAPASEEQVAIPTETPAS